MEDHAHLPQPPPPPAAPPGPRPSICSGPKRKVNRRLGLPPPPAAAGSSTAVGAQGSAAVAENGATATLPRKRPPRSPSSAPSTRKVRTTSTAAPPLEPAPASPQPTPLLSPSASLSSPPMPSMPHPAIFPGVSLDAQQVLDEMPESVDDESFFNIMDEGSFDFHVDLDNSDEESSNSYSLADDDHVDLDNSDDEDSDGKRSPTTSSAVPSTKRPPGRKKEKEKLKKGGDTTYTESVDNMMLSRKELAAERMEFKTSRWMELKEMEERRAAVEERRAAAAERRAAAVERRVAAEERRAAAEEMAKRLEQEQRIMFMDPTNLDEKRRAYFELLRDQLLAARPMGGFYMGGVIGEIGTNGGFAANGSTNIGGYESCTHVGGNDTE